MSRILRIAKMYHQQDSDVTEDLAITVAGAVLAIPVTHGYVAKTTGGTEACTLANGKPGQLMVINHVVDGGGTGMTLTPVTCTGFTTINFANAGDQAVLFYVDDIIGWIIFSAFGLLNQPTVA